MTDKHAGTERAQAARCLAFLKVGASHDVTGIQQHLRDAAHADAADADEMNFMFLVQHEISVSAKILSMGQRVALVDNARGSVGTSERARRRRHLLDPMPISQIAADLCR